MRGDVSPSASTQYCGIHTLFVAKYFSLILGEFTLKMVKMTFPAKYPPNETLSHLPDLADHPPSLSRPVPSGRGVVGSPEIPQNGKFSLILGEFILKMAKMTFPR